MINLQIYKSAIHLNVSIRNHFHFFLSNIFYNIFNSFKNLFDKDSFGME